MKKKYNNGIEAHFFEPGTQPPDYIYEGRLQKHKDAVSRKNKGKKAWNKGIPMRPESKKKLSEAHKGKKSWCKGLTKYDHPSIMRISKKLTGHEPHTSPEAVRKMINTKKSRHNINTSSAEKDLSELLKNLYGDNDVYTQYYDNLRYPYACDFYIKSLDLFIEYNGTLEHQNEPFDVNNPDHLELLAKYEEKAKNIGPRSRYYNVINWWTIKDPLKLKTLKENNLNYIIIYPASKMIITSNEAFKNLVNSWEIFK